VGIEAEGDRVLSREEVVELADAVAACAGIATGIGTNRYGARLVVQAGTRAEAIERGTAEFGLAVTTAGLPAWPIVGTEAVGENDESGGDWDSGGAADSGGDEACAADADSGGDG
jgi:hypothetical protein